MGRRRGTCLGQACMCHMAHAWEAACLAAQQTCLPTQTRSKNSCKTKLLLFQSVKEMATDNTLVRRSSHLMHEICF